MAGNNMTSAWLRHLQLRPHGRNLLTSGAEFWLWSACALVFLMAATEAVAWGYLGYLFAEGPIRWLTAALVALVIFVVVWQVDASLITFDRAWSEHASRLLGQQTRDRSRMVRTGATFTVRMMLLAGSLYITAPYLAQIVFHEDIQQLLDGEAAANIEAGRQQLTTDFDAKAGVVAAEIQGRREALAREVAGTGLSGRYGFGPTARAIAAEIENQQAEYTRLLAEKNRAIATYDEAVRDWRGNRDALAAKYNLALPETSILQNRRALDTLSARPENQRTELAIRAFLAFIFAGLLLLKLFEPTSIRLYMSEVLQQEYLRYLAGTFDEWLPPTERSQRPAAMSPQRLYDFLSTEWIPDRTRRARDSERISRAAAADRSVQQLEAVRTQLVTDAHVARTAYTDACEREESARQSLVELRSAVQIVAADIASHEAQLATWAGEETSGMLDDESRFERTALKSEVRAKLGEARGLLDRLRENLPVEEERERRMTAERQRWERECHAREEDLARLAQEIREIQVESSRQHAGWNVPVASEGR